MTNGMDVGMIDTVAVARTAEGASGPSRWRWPVMAGLLLATALLGWKAWQVNLAQTCWLNQWPYPQACDRVLGVEPAERLERLRERLAANPGDSAALVALAAYVEWPEGEPLDQKAALLDAAEKFAPQDGYVLRERVQQLMAEKRWPEALDRLTRLAQFHNDAEARRVLALMIGVSASDEAVGAALKAALKADGRWLEPALRAMPGAKVPMAAAMPLITDALAADGLSPRLSQLLIRQLRREGWVLEAHALWMQLWKKPLGFVFNGDFEQPFIEGGFDWEVNDKDTYKAGARVSQLRQGDRGQSLRVVFTGRTIKPPVLRQHLMLPPGDYRLSGDYRASELRSAEGLAWVFSCTKGGQELGRSEALKATGRDWKVFGGSLQVPPECGLGVTLALQTQATYEAKAGVRGEMLFDRIKLVRAETPAGQ